VFLWARWFGLPIGIANRITSVAKRLFRRDWDPLRDPEAASRRFPDGTAPLQSSHETA